MDLHPSIYAHARTHVLTVSAKIRMTDACPWTRVWMMRCESFRPVFVCVCVCVCVFMCVSIHEQITTSLFSRRLLCSLSLSPLFTSPPSKTHTLTWLLRLMIKQPANNRQAQTNQHLKRVVIQMVRRLCIEVTRLDMHEALFLDLGQFSCFLRLGCSGHFLKTIFLWVALRIHKGLFCICMCVLICVWVCCVCVRTQRDVVHM